MGFNWRRGGTSHVDGSTMIHDSTAMATSNACVFIIVRA
jgi:hypothetical protein